MDHLTTKQKILDASIRLFNLNDIANVRLQQIADETGISVGNLAYHFKNKEAIMTAVYDRLFDEFSHMLSNYPVNPELIEFSQQIEQYYRFFARYKFYLADLSEIERSYPRILERWQECVNNILLQIRKRLDYKQKKGILRPEPAAGFYDALSSSIWMTIVFWRPCQVLQGRPTDGILCKQDVWAHITPHFTAKGMLEFKSKVQPSMLS